MSKNFKLYLNNPLQIIPAPSRLKRQAKALERAYMLKCSFIPNLYQTLYQIYTKIYLFETEWMKLFIS